MKKIFLQFLIISAFILQSFYSQGQIFEPEGLNMPGEWDSWTNPPTNLVLANPNQTTGGLLIKYPNTVNTWKTTFQVATGGDIESGTYNWLFTSGPTTNYFQNKWSGVNVVFNQLQDYIKDDPNNNTVTLIDSKWYTMVWEDNDYANCRAIFMETAAEPVDIISVSEASDVAENEIVDVDFSVSTNPGADETFYLQYTIDGWSNSNIITATMAGTNGTASIPGQPESTVVEYNVFSSSVMNVSTDGFLYAMKLNDNNGLNYSYIVGTPLPDTIGWANLQWPANGNIVPEADYVVYGQAYIYNLTEQADTLVDLQAWIGYNSNDTDPSTWTNWIPAYYFGADGNNDEYSANLGSFMDQEGTFYYATRFQYLSQDYVYGGFSEGDGDFWDGVDYVSGVLTVSEDPPPVVIGWANLQWPANGVTEPSTEFNVYSQVWIEDITGTGSATPDLQAWIGYSETNTDPSTWTNWVSSNYEEAAGGNDQFVADIGTEIATAGTYYYASRFKYLDQDDVYGGYSEAGGGFWDDTDYVSGTLTVTSDPIPDTIGWANLQWPALGEILPSEEFVVFGQAWIDGVTTQSDSLIELEAWIGYNANDSDPSTWSDWLPAYYFGEDGDNDEYSADIGSLMDTEGVVYYATRFKYPNQEYVYGGYSESGGDFWDGVDFVNGMLTITSDPAPDTIGWANLQWPPTGAIEPQQEFNVYAQAWIDEVTGSGTATPDLEAWIGFSDTDTDPATWTDWVVASFDGVGGANDQFFADIGTGFITDGTYYYATRFKYPEQEYVYGGYSESGGGFWDGSDYVSGVLTVFTDPIPDTIGWANLQWPPSGEILPEGEFVVYGQAWIDEVTTQSDSLIDLEAWIGYNEDDTDPSTWTNWVPAYYLGEDGDNDEYSAEIGSLMLDEGVVYYATRFKYPEQDYVYGGYSNDGGDFWDGTDYINGILIITPNPAPDSIGWANLQWPPTGAIEPEQEFEVYAQAWIDGVTGTGSITDDLEAWIGYSSTDTDPSTWTNWVATTYDGAEGLNDQFTADIGTGISTEGTYYYATRFKYPEQEFVYGGYSEGQGGFWDGVDNVNGVLTVSEALESYPVEFEVTDATGLYSNVKLKGDMTSWIPVDMNQDGNDWTIILDIYPGTYEWGVFEDDSSPDGIWLVIGDNLVMSVDNAGLVSGDTTYTITFVGIDELSSTIGIYPNPVKETLMIEKSTSGQIEIQILDAAGSVIDIRHFHSSKIKMDVSTLAPGFYLMKLKEGELQQTLKFIKQ